MPAVAVLLGLTCFLAAAVLPTAEGRPAVLPTACEGQRTLQMREESKREGPAAEGHVAPTPQPLPSGWQPDGLGQADALAAPLAQHFLPTPLAQPRGNEAQPPTGNEAQPPTGNEAQPPTRNEALPTGNEAQPPLSAPHLLQPGEAALSWKLEPNKYLLPFCSFGRMSNQVRCLKNTFRLAVVLNRTLLLPPKNTVFFRGEQQEDWRLDTLVDVNRMARCLRPAYGPNTVSTFEEYLQQSKAEKVVVHRIRCAVPGPPEQCAHMTRIQAMLHAVGPTLSLPSLADYPGWLDTSPLPSGRPVPDSEIAAAFRGVPDAVLCAGEMFRMTYENKDVGKGVLARPAECNNLWRPHPAISQFVDGVLRESFKGEGFAAIHLRRGDFYLESRVAHESHQTGNPYYTYSPITDVALVVVPLLKGAGLRALYLATDASKIEVEVFSQVLKGLIGVVRVVTLRRIRENQRLWAQPWAQGALELANGSTAGIPWILADKGVASRASLFLGTKSSSFSRDILDMRCDERRLRGSDKTSFLCSSTGCTAAWCNQ